MRFIVGRFTSFSTEIESFPKIFLYSMKIKVQTRKLAAGCSKHCFEVVDRTDEVSNHIYGKVKLTWFEEIFEEYKSPHNKTHTIKVFMYCPQKLDRKNLTFGGQYISIPDTMRFFNFKDFLQFLLTHIKLF
ncbi:chlorohydrolase [Streptococcus pneumoniae]|nr:chlorohydrolase [Streptococcus pneumoniae]